MSYCGPRAIPHSWFLGGPFLWTPGDRDNALAWQEMDRQTCRDCGTRPEEWSPKQGGDRHAYVAEVRVCSGCVVRERGEVELNDPARKNQRGKKLVMRRSVPSTEGP